MSDSPYLDALRKRVETARQLHTEMEMYDEWTAGAAKTAQVNFRISKGDLAAFKALARAQGKRYQTLLVDLIRREIGSEGGRGRGKGGSLKAVRVTEPY